MAIMTSCVLASSITGPIGETVAFRVDGVYVKRDGFYRDDQNGRDVNNRDRYFLRGQLLFEPSDALSVRLIADYTSRKEECCAATYVDANVNQYIGNLNNPSTPLAPLQTDGKQHHKRAARSGPATWRVQSRLWPQHFGQRQPRVHRRNQGLWFFGPDRL